MKTLQDLENEAIYNYIDEVVESLPKKLRAIFEEDLARFAIDQHGHITLDVEKKLSDEKAEQLYLAICRFVDTHPSPFLEQIVLH